MTIKRLLSLTLASLLVVGISGLAMAGIPDETESTATGGPGCFEIVPDGSGATLASAGLTITVTVEDGNGDPIAGFPFQDVWAGDNAGGTEILLCNGGSTASANTNAAGITTITGSIAGGGGTFNGMQVYLSGVPLTQAALLIDIVSADLNSNREVSLTDLSNPTVGLAVRFNNGVYDPESDFNCDTAENLLDVVRFALRLGTACP